MNYLLSYLDYVPFVLNVAASMMSGIATTDNFSCISCSYDIIANDDLHWDSDKPTFAGESLFHTLLKPIGWTMKMYFSSIDLHIIRERNPNNATTEDQENLREFGS